MTTRVRALLGAAAGALLVLVSHPATRPGMLTAFRPVPPGGLAALLARPPLRLPTDVDSGAAYLHAGAERLEAGKPLLEAERRTLLAIAAQGELSEPNNPFWPMARFVFLGGEGPEARGAWRRASRCKRYFDHQRSALLADRDRIAARVGDVQAWTYAAIRPQRSSAMLLQIKFMTLRHLQTALREDERLDFAYETIRNGGMIRDGSEGLELGLIGIEMIEGATYPRELSPTGKGSKIYRLWIAKTNFTAELSRRGRKADADECYGQFRTNDGWQAFRDVASPEDRFTALALSAVALDALPGALLIMGIAGTLIWIVSLRLSRLAFHDNRFRGAGIGAFCLALLSIGILIGYPVVGIAAGACALVLASGPERPRPFDDATLGPLHELVVTLFALALGGGLVLVAADRSLPGRLLPRLGETGLLLGDAERWSALSIALLGATALAPPAWAFVRRYPTPALAALTYRNLGRTMAAVGLGLSLLASPVCLALDRWLGTSLAEIALNEQNAYSPSQGGER